LNDCGGGEKVALYSLKAMLERGHEVILDVKEKTDWERVTRILGVRPRGKIKERVQPKRFERFTIYQNLFHFLYRSLEPLRDDDFDIRFNTSGEYLLPDLTYVNGPPMYVKKAFSKYESSLFWRIYFEPYRFLSSCLNRILNRSFILVNSIYTASFMEYRMKSGMIIYPPVEVENLLPLISNDRREDSVISIGRLSPEKKWHLLPLIAAKMPEINFYLLASKQSKEERYHKILLELKERLNVDNLKIIVDPPYENKLKLMSESKVLLHLMPHESFGLVVAEGMASGLIPVVHMSGGQWIDVLEEGRYGIAYKHLNLDEISKIVRKALKCWSFSEAKRVAQGAKRFSAENFANKVISVIESLEGVQKHYV
jgi:glycosyltransferase involved in cell wall biosynthesis